MPRKHPLPGLVVVGKPHSLEGRKGFSPLHTTPPPLSFFLLPAFSFSSPSSTPTNSVWCMDSNPFDALRSDEGRKKFAEGLILDTSSSTTTGTPATENEENKKIPPSYSTGSNVWSWVNPKLELKTSEKSGKGHFAKAPIKKDESLVCWAGRIIHKDDLKTLSQDEYDYILQVDEEFFQAPFMHPYHEPADFINHSCEPTAGFGGSPITLVAIRDIDVGEEITFDYCMDTSYDMDFECRCGSVNCRGRVTGSDWKIPALQQKYQFYFSPYLWRKIYKMQEEERKGKEEKGNLYF